MLLPQRHRNAHATKGAHWLPQCQVHRDDVNFPQNMAKRTKKQQLVQQTSRHRAWQLISSTRKQLRTLLVSKHSSQAPILALQDPSQALHTLQHALFASQAPRPTHFSSQAPEPTQIASQSLRLSYATSQSSSLALPAMQNAAHDANSLSRNLLLRDAKTNAPSCMVISPTLFYWQMLANKLAEKGY